MRVNDKKITDNISAENVEILVKAKILWNLQTKRKNIWKRNRN